MRLTVTTWNVLADAYAVRTPYPDSPAALLVPGARRQAVVAVVASLGSDVVCLQEAEESLGEALEVALGATHRVLWCPKGAGRPDGCLTIVTRNWEITGHERHLYDDAPVPTGHVAQVVDLRRSGEPITVANTHLRWAPPQTAPDDHVGVCQARLLVRRLAGCSGPVVVAADANDEPGGPVRAVLAGAGAGHAF